jgi:hypothetical protein
LRWGWVLLKDVGDEAVGLGAGSRFRVTVALGLGLVKGVRDEG